MTDVYADLRAAGDDTDLLVRDLEPAEWTRPTPASGWTIAHQVAHLSAVFRMAALAAAQPEAFSALIGSLSSDFGANVNAALAEYLAEEPAVLLGRFREERARVQKALEALPPEHIVPWLVRPIPAGLLAAAGMMELFGHGQDIADALQVRRPVTDRLGHLVGFAVRTWDFGYQARGLATPAVEFRFDISAPSGAVWSFGPADAANRIEGPAEDFCLLVTRRRHPDDLAVRATGAEATHWLQVAQAYRGPAGEGRRPGQFAYAS